MVFRLMAGSAPPASSRVLMMPAADGLGASAAPRGCGANRRHAPCPALEELDMPPRRERRATPSRRRRDVRARACAAIVVLGGDGTHRVVAKRCGDVPLCALSTGHQQRLPGDARGDGRRPRHRPRRNGRVPARRRAAPREGARTSRATATAQDLALVDVAVTAERFLGARAVWRRRTSRELFVAFARPGAVGLSAIAGLLEPSPAATARRCTFGCPTRAMRSSSLARAARARPDRAGRRRRVRALEPGRRIELAAAAGSLALDGEREIELQPEPSREVRLAAGRCASTSTR